jgi:hypothetical protein
MSFVLCIIDNYDKWLIFMVQVIKKCALIQYMYVMTGSLGSTEW